MNCLFKSLTLFLICATYACANYGSKLKEYDFGTADIIRDDTRDRIYCTVPSSNSVVVIDSELLNVIATIYCGSDPAGLDLSPDSSKLYVANSGTTEQGIAVIDLTDLKLTHHIATIGYSRDVCAGLNDIVYSLESGDRLLRAYDAIDGSAYPGGLGTYAGGVSVYGGLMSLSNDHQTLYYYQTGLSPSSWYKIDVNTWPGTKLLSGSYGSNGQDMEMSKDGNFISFASGSPYSIQKFSTDTPSTSYGTMSTGPYPRAVAFSADANELFAVHTGGHIDVWNANTYVQTTEISTENDPRDLESDRTGRVLFAGSSTQLTAYYISRESDTGSTEATIYNAVEIRWDSQFGKLYQVQWRTFAGQSSNDWQDLGSPSLGTGLMMSVYDSTRHNRKKFYRIQKVTP